MTIVLIVIAVILLVLHWKGPNAVWGCATLGVLVGIVISIALNNWEMLGVSFAVSTFIGTLFEWIGRFAEYMKHRS